MNKLSILSGLKIPEYIRTEYPKLVTFVEAYYRFVELGTTIDNAGDIDIATEQFVKQYKESLARGFADPQYISVRDFIYANKDFFSRKGTHDSFEFFFKAYFGQEIKITKPDYLIASGGNATGDYFFYVNKEFGSISQYDNIVLTYSSTFTRSGKLTASVSSDTVTSDKSSFLTSDIGLSIYINGKLIGEIKEFISSTSVKLTANSNFNISQAAFHLSGATSSMTLDVLRFELLDANTYAIYFVPPRGFKSSVGDLVTVGTTFRGTVKATPYKAVPVNPGKYWQVGQVITLPSTDGMPPSVIRVKQIDADGGIKSLEILKYSYPLSGEQYSISSFAVAADHTTDSTNYEQTIYDDGHYDQNFTVYDNTGKVEDSTVFSIVDYTSADLYAGDDYPDEYASQDYFGELKAYEPFRESLVVEHTEQEYIDSFATIKILTNSFSKEYTRYSDNSSLISNSVTKIHDNLKYQAFAYAIETNIDIKQYRGSFDLLHPAGMKFSATHVKESPVLNTDATIIGTHTFPTIEGSHISGQAGTVATNFVLGLAGIQGSGTISNIG